MVDVARDPRWGRIVEGAGEDPFLGSAMAAAQVRGFQGSDLSAHDTVVAATKHFGAYGAAEGGRDYAAADISERTLRETYLPPFEAAARAGTAASTCRASTAAGATWWCSTTRACTSRRAATTGCRSTASSC